MSEMTEAEITSAFVLHVRTEHPDLLFCGTVGGVNAPIGQKVKANREGYNKGIPDLIFYEPRGKHHGLAIEMKTRVGRLRPHQEEWIFKLADRGYKAVVCRSLEEAKQVLKNYLSQE
jgi:hypothetical protein